MKTFCNNLNNRKTILKTNPYTTEQIKEIVKILLLLAKKTISMENARTEIVKVSDPFSYS